MSRPLSPVQLAIVRALAAGGRRLGDAELRFRLRATGTSEREIGIGLRALVRRGVLRRAEDAPRVYELAEEFPQPAPAVRAPGGAHA